LNYLLRVSTRTQTEENDGCKNQLIQSVSAEQEMCFLLCRVDSIQLDLNDPDCLAFCVVEAPGEKEKRHNINNGR
jgi:hypothetical protein